MGSATPGIAPRRGDRCGVGVCSAESHALFSLRFSFGGITEVIPRWAGLIDSPIHIIRGRLSYDTELRWDGVR